MENINKKKLERIKINPFSIAKYFYEKGIEDIAIIQKLTYLTFLEVLKEENILLELGEEFQAWDDGPIIERVFFAMSEDWDKYGTYKKTFKNVPILNEEKIIKHCEIWIKIFKEVEEKQDQYKISEASQNQPWVIARSKVNNYSDYEKIELNDIIIFVQNGNSQRVGGINAGWY